MRRLLPIHCLLSSVLWAPGCAQTGIVLPPLPAWQAPTLTPQASDLTPPTATFTVIKGVAA